MQRLTIFALCALIAVVAAQSNGFTASGSFEADEKTRFSIRAKLVSRAGCGCASANNPEGNWDGCDGSGDFSGDLPTGSPSGIDFETTVSGVEPSTPAISTTEGDIESTTTSGVEQSTTVGADETTTTTSGAEDTTTSGVESTTLSSIETTIADIISTISGIELSTVSTIGGEESTVSGIELSTPSVPNSSGSGDISGSGLCETSGEYAETHGGWFEGDYCFLLSVFIEWCEELSVEDSIIFRAFIDECQKTIIVNGKYTDDERLVLIQFKLKAFLEIHISISETIKWKFIEKDGFSWGLTGFLEGCELDIVGGGESTEITKEEVITVENGKCPLTEAADEWAGEDEEKRKCAASFKSAVLVIVEGEFTVEEKFAKLHQVFIDFSANFTEQYESFFEYSIEGFAPVGVFSDYCSREWRVANFELAIGGDFQSCALLKAIVTIEEDTTLSISFRSQIKQWHDSIEVEINKTTDIDERIKFFGSNTYQYFLLNNWNVSIIFNCNITGFGTIYELIDAFTAYANGQITRPDGSSTIAPSSEAPTTPEVSTTVEVTTEAPTTTPTTTTTTTTTEAPGSCSSKYEVQAFSSNTTDLLESIQTAQTSWSTSQVNQFKGYYKKLYNIASNTTITQESVYSQSVTVLTGFASKTSTIYTQVQAIVIKKWGGKVSDYCGCA